MNIHEYQAKSLLKRYGISVPEHTVVNSVEKAVRAYGDLDLDRAVIKSQVHSGARGKAGGVRIVDNRAALEQEAKEMLGVQLVTHQTGPEGLPVNQLLIEAPSLIDRELYLGAVVDREARAIVFMASTEGGVDIETVAAESPDKILTCTVNPLVGLQPYQCRQIAFDLALVGQQVRQLTHMMLGMAQFFVERDLSLLEINPLVVTATGELLCLDAKVNIDDNALFRQPELRDMRDATQEDARENRAAQSDLSYIALEGDIGCMVNGAGLAMATMDLIKLHGGAPANFLDVGGTATAERVTEAFNIILSDENIKAILVNIFGGIVRCDLIADGIIDAVSKTGINVPVVVRLEGNNAELAREKLAQSGLNIIAADQFSDAAIQVVQQAQQGAQS
jgi:succinyl-CoA synthetase beta subunit